MAHKIRPGQTIPAPTLEEIAEEIAANRTVEHEGWARSKDLKTISGRSQKWVVGILVELHGKNLIEAANIPFPDFTGIRIQPVQAYRLKKGGDLRTLFERLGNKSREE